MMQMDHWPTEKREQSKFSGYHAASDRSLTSAA